MLRVTPLDTFPLHAYTAPPSVKRYTATRVREITAVVRLFVLHAGYILQVRRTGYLRVVDTLPAPTVITKRTPYRHMVRDVHLDLRTPHTMDERTVAVVPDVHT